MPHDLAGAAFHGGPLEARDVGGLRLLARSGCVAGDGVVFALQALQFAAALAATVLQCRVGRRLHHRALLQVGRVVATEHLHPQGRQFDDALHAVEQAPVVTDQDQATAPGGQLRHQPVPTRSVQVIAWLIQHQ